MSDITSPQDYYRNSLTYFEAAKIIEKSNYEDNLISPCCQNLGLALELLLKSEGLRAGAGQGELKKHGHDLMGMWNDSKFSSDIKSRAQFAAPSFVDRIPLKWGVPCSSLELDSPEVELEKHLNWLSAGYSSISTYALRYPRGGVVTEVPAPEFLIPLFDIVYDHLSVNWSW